MDLCVLQVVMKVDTVIPSAKLNQSKTTTTDLKEMQNNLITYSKSSSKQKGTTPQTQNDKDMRQKCWDTHKAIYWY